MSDDYVTSGQGNRSADRRGETASAPIARLDRLDDADGGGRPSLSRRRVLGGLGGLAAAGLTVGQAGAQESDGDVPSPTVEGPIEGGSATGGPQAAAPIDVTRYGYVEEEYFVSGDARHDHYFTDGENADETAAYKTRVLVYRPESAWQFNGSVLTEWFNVSTQVDAAVAWPNAYDTLMRNGTAVALVSAQEVGVENSGLNQDLVTWDPERYGDLSHPGDEYALDIFAQVNEALTPDQSSGSGQSGGSGWWGGFGGRGQDEGEDGDDGDPHPLGDLDAETLLATGHSQSGFFLLRYINLAAPAYGRIDGFLPAGSPLTTARADVAPILWFNSEDETGSLEDFGEDGEEDTDISLPPTGLRIEEATDGPRDDEGQFKLWEVAGASHVNNWLSRWSAAQRARDFEGGEANFDPDAAGQYGELPDANYDQCDYNYFPARFAWRAAVESLREWVTLGDEPDRVDRIERTTDDEGTTTLARDEYGNAKGGLRLPVLDVPVATYEGSSCGLTGKTIRFDEATLDELYPSNGAYVGKIRKASTKAVGRGHLRRQDARYLVRRARQSPVGESASESPAGNQTAASTPVENQTSPWSDV